VSREAFWAAGVSFSQLQARLSQSARQLSLFEKSARGCQKDRDFAATDSLECLNTLSGHFGVRLHFTESLAWRIKRHETGVSQRLQIGKPAFRAGNAFGDNHEKPAGAGMRERGNNDCVAGTWEAGSVYPAI